MIDRQHPNTGPNGEAHGCRSPGCAAWGAFGFRGQWFCTLHRDQGEAVLRAWAGDIAARLVADHAGKGKA